MRDGRAFIIAGILCAGGCFEWMARSHIERRFHHTDPRVFVVPRLKSMKRITYSPDTLQIALFGTSITSSPSLARRLKEELAVYFTKPIRMYNLSFVGGSIMDSYYLYNWASERRFDIVLSHHTYGAFRLNKEVPYTNKSVTNISWFRRRQALDRYGDLPVRFPLALSMLLIDRLERRGRIYTDWNISGRRELAAEDIRDNVGLAPFAHFYRKLINVARKRKECIIALTHSYPPAAAIEWLPQYHEAIVDLGVPMIDIQPFMQQKVYYKDDLCHWTNEGRQRFAVIVARELSYLARSGRLSLPPEMRAGFGIGSESGHAPVNTILSPNTIGIIDTARVSTTIAPM